MSLRWKVGSQEIMKSCYLLPLAPANSNRNAMSPKQAWESFVAVTEFCSQSFSFLWQLELIRRSTRAEFVGPLFIIICLSGPLCERYFQQSLFPNGIS
jgi:hypothetical protein